MTTTEDQLLQDLLHTFQIEAAEHLEAINQALLQFEQSADAQQRETLVQTAFRAAHSLKGAARAVSSNDVEGLAHAMESVLQQVRSSKMQLTPAIGDVLYDTLDVIKHVLDGEQVTLPAAYAKLTAIGADAPMEQQPAVSAASPVKHAEETIRVAISKLDNLMAESGELTTSKVSAEQHLNEMAALRRQMERWPKSWRTIRALLPHVDAALQQQLTDILTDHYESLQEFGRQMNGLHQSMSRDTLRLSMVMGRLQDEVRAARMVPFQTLIAGLQRAVRDAARSEGKQIAPLRIEGADVELDKKILEALKDPLLHLLRNAVGHGIESPDARREAGKEPEGRIALFVQQRGSEVRITVRDDGRGFDLQAIREAGQRNNGVALDETANPDDVIALAFTPGVTTSEQVTALSGRGVGLDVVRQVLETLQGRIQVESKPGQGSSIQLVVPVSLSMTRGLLVRVGDERYVLPLLSVEKIVEPRDTFSVEGQLMLMLDGKPILLGSLAAALERPQTALRAGEKTLAVILGIAEQRVALLVDDVLSEYELAVKPLGKLFQQVPNVSGAALLGSGEPVVVLNPADLVRTARRAGVTALPTATDNSNGYHPNHILIVDDSITTRTLEKNILEAAGYHVITATDGLGAIKRLKEQPVDLVVSDIQMPSMDGFALTRYLRDSGDYHKLPVILVTSLESPEDREQGLQAGANAYIVKRGFDQAELLSTISQFLEASASW